MKTSSRIFRRASVVLAIAAVGACATKLHCSKAPVEIGKDYAILRPEAALSERDYEALDRILAKHSKSLYKVQSYKRGELKNTKGELKDEDLCVGLASEVAESARSTRFTGCALQFGGPSTYKRFTDSKELVKTVSPILKKYQKK